MTAALESVLLTNPSRDLTSPLETVSMAFCRSPPPSSMRFQSLFRPRSYRVDFVSPTVPTVGLGSRFVPLDRRASLNRLVVSFAASHEDSKHSEIEVEKEKKDLDAEAKESEQAWKQTLASFKEQALKMQNLSQEAYELYSQRAMVILKETSEQLRIQADKARYDLSEVAKEISEGGREYLSTAASNSPEPVKDIVDTFTSSTDDLDEPSKVRDFYVGIPYGFVLSVGGFLLFMLNGSISAIRFGVILGGTLLALSVSSLRSWKKGESVPLALEGQAVIAGILFLREARLISQRSSFLKYFTAFISGAVAVFYIYRILSSDELTEAPELEPRTEN